MIYLIIAAVAVLIMCVSIVYTVLIYRELAKWAHLSNSTMIAIAHKNKVRMQHSITEWMKWAQMLDKDERYKGRVIYTMSGTSVLIKVPDTKKVSHRLARYKRMVKRITVRIKSWPHRKN